MDECDSGISSEEPTEDLSSQIDEASGTEGWLGEVTPEDEEQASRRLPDVFADTKRGKGQGTEPEIIVHSRRAKISNKGIIILGAVLLLASCYLQVFLGKQNRQASELTDESTQVPAVKEPENGSRKSTSAKVPSELPGIQAVGAVCPGSAPVYLRVVLANGQSVPSLPGTLHITFQDPQRGEARSQVPIAPIVAGGSNTLSLRTPYVSVASFENEGNSFVNDQGQNVVFHLEVSSQ